VKPLEEDRDLPIPRDGGAFHRFVHDGGLQVLLPKDDALDAVEPTVAMTILCTYLNEFMSALKLQLKVLGVTGHEWSATLARVLELPIRAVRRTRAGSVGVGTLTHRGFTLPAVRFTSCGALAALGDGRARARLRQLDRLIRYRRGHFIRLSIHHPEGTKRHGSE
jgi:hypothetical protein